jgi:hypothetical protein
MTNLKLFQGKLHPEDFKDILNVKYSTYKARANKKDIVFELSEYVFNEKIKEPCYLCGKQISTSHKNGLDRFDSDIGYIEKNVNSCCGNCNMIKRDYNYDDFIKVSCNSLEKLEWPTIVANWDRTPRVKHKGEIFLNFTPEKFKKLYKKAVKLIETRPEEEKIIFIKSWNEWAEGNYLEPDIKYGRDLLDAIKD